MLPGVPLCASCCTETPFLRAARAGNSWPRATPRAKTLLFARCRLLVFWDIGAGVGRRVYGKRWAPHIYYCIAVLTCGVKLGGTHCTGKWVSLDSLYRAGLQMMHVSCITMQRMLHMLRRAGPMFLHCVLTATTCSSAWPVHALGIEVCQPVKRELPSVHALNIFARQTHARTHTDATARGPVRRAFAFACACACACACVHGA
jgi:hypothetical protein